MGPSLQTQEVLSTVRRAAHEDQRAAPGLDGIDIVLVTLGDRSCGLQCYPRIQRPTNGYYMEGRSPFLFTTSVLDRLASAHLVVSKRHSPWVVQQKSCA